MVNLALDVLYIGSFKSHDSDFVKFNFRKFLNSSTKSATNLEITHLDVVISWILFLCVRSVECLA